MTRIVDFLFERLDRPIEYVVSQSPIRDQPRGPIVEPLNPIVQMVRPGVAHLALGLASLDDLVRIGA